MTETVASPTPAALIPWEDPAVGSAAGLFRTIGMVIGKPTEAFLRVGAGSGLGRPLVFGVLVGYVALVAALVWNALTRALTVSLLSEYAPELQNELARNQAFSDAAVTIVLAVAGPFLVALTILIWGGLFHLFLMLFGGAARPFPDTLRVVAYAQACQVFGLLPLCGGLIALVWGVVVQIMGITAMHRCGSGKAAAAVLAPMFGCCVCAIAAYAIAVATVLSMAR